MIAPTDDSIICKSEMAGWSFFNITLTRKVNLRKTANTHEKVA